MKKLLMTTLLLSLTFNSHASILGAISKAVKGKAAVGTEDTVRVVSRISSKRNDLSIMKKVDFYESDDDLNKVLLKTIDEKVDEAQLRVATAISDIDGYYTFGSGQALSITQVLRNNYAAIQILMHNHVLLKEMSKAERANYLDQHKDLVKRIHEVQDRITVDKLELKTHQAQELVKIFLEHKLVLNQIRFEIVTMR